jgi:hypothetical protein
MTIIVAEQNGKMLAAAPPGAFKASTEPTDLAASL